MGRVSRRQFLKASGFAGAATALVTGTAAAQTVSPNLEGTSENGQNPATNRMAMLMDNSLCVNCHSCRLACQNENKLPVTEKYIRFDYIETGRFPNVKRLLNRHSCMHCEEAPCIGVCPVNALEKGAEGFTHTDFETCIGCGVCLHVCPFEVPVISEEAGTGKPKMYKCNGCRHLIAAGIAPACATNCITGAVQYGTWDEMRAKAEERVAKLRATSPGANVYGIDEQGGLGLLLVLRTPPADYPHLV